MLGRFSPASGMFLTIKMVVKILDTILSTQAHLNLLRIYRVVNYGEWDAFLLLLLFGKTYFKYITVAMLAALSDKHAFLYLNLWKRHQSIVLEYEKQNISF